MKDSENILIPEKERFRGCLLGLAVGDAVGTTVEFAKRGSFDPVTDLVGGGPFNLPAGAWTDDTSMALCLAESLLELQGFDAADQMKRYVRWYDHGHLSSTGRCFDIGGTVLSALEKYRHTGDPVAGSTEPRSAGNGSLMRLAPVPMFYYPDRDLAAKFSEESSLTTHGCVECRESCRLLGTMLHLALEGADKETILFRHGVDGLESEKTQAVATGRWRDKPRDEIRGSGYVVDCLEASLWCFHHTNSFEEAVLTAVNLGDDADTTGAVTGQLAGAFHGVEGIPAKWRRRIVMRSLIEEWAEELRAGGPARKS